MPTTSNSKSATISSDIKSATSDNKVGTAYDKAIRDNSTLHATTVLPESTFNKKPKRLITEATEFTTDKSSTTNSDDIVVNPKHTAKETQKMSKTKPKKKQLKESEKKPTKKKQTKKEQTKKKQTKKKQTKKKQSGGADYKQYYEEKDINEFSLFTVNG